MRNCAEPNCDRPHVARGKCKSHYRRWRDSADGLAEFTDKPARSCRIDGCAGRHQAQGLCRKHYTRLLVHGDPLATLYHMDGKPRCSVEGCPREVKAKELCPKHYLRRLRGAPLSPPRERGDGWINEDGYRMRQINGRATGVHRFVMEEIIGRQLLPHETVHHRNGDRLDNRPENLELWSSSHPPGQRAHEKLAWARQIIALYEPCRTALKDAS